MKKWISLLCVCMLLLLLAGCGGDEDPTSDNSAPATKTERKLGLGSVNTVTVDGTDRAVIKTTVAAVVLDGNGNIADCELDELTFPVTLQNGLPQPVEELISKLEMGDAYTPQKDELGETAVLTDSWEDQVEAFCDHIEGKSPAEVSGIAATDGKSAQIEGCDLIITDFIQAVRHAGDNAKAQTVGAGDDLTLALTAVKAEGATDDKPQYDVEMAAVTVGDGDRITGCVTDTLQAKLTVAEAVFTTASGGIETKRQMGDGYGMKAASGIKREWYEQADAFDTYAVGKTAAELAKTTLDSEGKTDAITGCTVSVSAMLKNAVKAAEKE